MPLKLLVPLLAILLALWIGYGLAGARRGESARSSGASSSTVTKRVAAVRAAESPQGPTPSKPVASQAGPVVSIGLLADASRDNRPTEVLVQEIQKAASQYDPRYLKFIVPYLKHADAAVRAAAVTGIADLGDVSGARILKAAAAQTENTEEAIRMLELAKWLELPPMPPEMIRKHLFKAPGTGSAPAAGAGALPRGPLLPVPGQRPKGP